MCVRCSEARMLFSITQIGKCCVCARACFPFALPLLPLLTKLNGQCIRLFSAPISPSLFFHPSRPLTRGSRFQYFFFWDALYSWLFEWRLVSSRNRKVPLKRRVCCASVSRGPRWEGRRRCRTSWRRRWTCRRLSVVGIPAGFFQVVTLNMHRRLVSVVLEDGSPIHRSYSIK